MNSALSAPTQLGSAPIGKLLLQYAAPAIIAMTASSLYNLVDSIFVGQGCGTLAFSGLTITFSLMNILAAFGSLVGVGGSAVLSIKLGQKDYDSAQLVLGNVVILNVIIGTVVGIIGLIFLDPILYLFGASDQTLPYARSYMLVILFANFFTHIYYGLNGVLRSAGHPKLAMYATIVAVGINIILDPIFIFGLDMGIQGAATATVISQLIAIVLQIVVLCKPNELLHFSKACMRLDKRIACDLLAIGVSPFLMNLAACAVVVVLNNQLKRYGGDIAIGAYGVINRITFIFCMIVMGLNQGMQPIAGYNYGAQKYDRMLEALKKTAICATVVTSALFLCAELCPQWVAHIFSSDEELIQIASRGMRIVCAVFFINGYQMATGNFFTSIGMAKLSIFLSLTRQVIYLIPFALIFPYFWGLDGVWASMCTADVLSCITSVIILTIYVKKFRQLQQAIAQTNPPKPEKEDLLG